MMNRLARSVSMGAALLALGIGGFAQAETKSDMKDKSANNTAAKTTSCTMDDAAKVRSVMQFLHAANQSEIRLGKMALSKSQNADVKAQADRMVKDHTEADKTLTDLAAKQNVNLDAPMTDPLYLGAIAAEDSFARELGGKNGNAFDMSYVGHASSDHALVLKVLEEGQKAAKDQTKQTFDQMHATIASHKELADKTMRSLQGNVAPPKAIGGGPNENKKPSKTSPEKSKKPSNDNQDNGNQNNDNQNDGNQNDGNQNNDNQDKNQSPDNNKKKSPENKPSPDIQNNPDNMGPKY